MELKELRKMTGSRPQPPRKGPWGQHRKLSTAPPVDSCSKFLQERRLLCHTSPPGRGEHQEPLQGAGLEAWGGLAELLCGEGRGLAFLWSHSDQLLKPGPSGRLLQTAVCAGTDPPSWSSSKARHFPHDSGLPSLLGH